MKRIKKPYRPVYGVGKPKAWDDPEILKIDHREGKPPSNTHTREVRVVGTAKRPADTIKGDMYYVTDEREFDPSKIPTPHHKKGDYDPIIGVVK